MVLYVGTGVSFLTRRLRLSKADVVLGVLGLLFVISAAWSTRPQTSFVYGTAVLLNLLFVGQMAGAMDLDAFLALFARLVVVLCVIGLLLFGIGVEAAAYIDIHERLTLLGTIPMRGLFNHKISASFYAVMAILVVLATQSGVRRLGVVLFLSVFILLTGSATGVALLLIAVGALAYVRVSVRAKLAPNAFVAILVAVGTSAAVLGITVLPALLRLLGRDPTLTGRTLLWAWGVQTGLQRPILGWGYSGYLGSPAAEAMRRSYRGFVGYDVPHFHNGFVQSFSDLGIVGLILMLLLLLGGARGYYAQALRSGTDAPAAMSALLLLVCGAGVVMNTFFKYNEFTVILLGVAAIGLLRVGRLSRSGSHLGGS